jgi:small GTP-binding protein
MKKEFPVEELIRRIISKSKTITEEENKKVMDLLNKEIRERPFKVAVIGQSGVGKTSTIQSVFGVQPSTSNRVRSVEEGTRDVEEKVFDIKDGFSLSIADMPGLKNDILKDEKVYIPLYKEILPDCDLIVYIIDANAKELGIDIKILRDTVIPICKEAGKANNIIIALNKIDTIGESFPEYRTNKEYHWNRKENKPTETLAKLIEERLREIYHRLIKGNINEYIDISQEPAISAVYAFGMQGFLEAILKSERGWIFAGTVAGSVMAKASERRINK